MSSNAFYLRPYSERAPDALRGKKDQIGKKTSLPGVALPSRIDLLRRESYVPRLHNPALPLRPGAENFLQFPSLHGAQTTYRDRGHV